MPALRAAENQTRLALREAQREGTRRAEFLCASALFGSILSTPRPLYQSKLVIACTRVTFLSGRT